MNRSYPGSRKPLFLLASVLLTALVVYAVPASAETTHEARLWVELGLRYEPARRFTIGLDQHFRIDENISNTQSLISEISVRYSIVSWLRLETGYRLAYERDNGGLYRRRHRLHFDVRSAHRLGPVRLGLRVRFQEEIRSASDNGEPWNHTLRFRTDATLRRVFLEPGLAFEVFLPIADAETSFTVKKLRGTLGISIDTQAGTVDLGYRIEGVFLDNELRHIILLEWHFDIME